jgi:hypothetical protein
MIIAPVIVPITMHTLPHLHLIQFFCSLALWQLLVYCLQHRQFSYLSNVESQDDGRRQATAVHESDR